MFNLITNNGTKLSVNLLVVITVTNTTEVKVRTVTDVELILLGPTNKVVIAISSFHGR
jgi:hypothetical protein